MPELPEVETMRRDVLERVVGHMIVDVDVRLRKSLRFDAGLDEEALIGRRIEQVTRRAKLLLVELDAGLTLLMHMRLSGQLARVWPDGRYSTAGHPVPAYGAPLPHKATHIVIGLDDGSKIYYTDIRQFGFMHLMPTAEVPRYVEARRYGVEPLSPEFTRALLADLLQRRGRARMKPLLIDQSVVAGLGNIYADEVLWMSGVHPLRTAGSLDADEVERLHRAIVEVLHEAITHGVAEVRNGRAVAGARLPRIHGREGQPCLRCGTIVERIRVGGRSTYVCPRCQPISAEELAASTEEVAVEEE